MKRIFIIIFFYSFTQVSYTQNVSVEPSIWNIQSGYLGIWMNYEVKIEDDIALLGEIGLDLITSEGTELPTNKFALVPKIRFEPRWYYDLGKRKMKSKNTLWNSGSYISIQLIFHSNLGVISNANNLYVPAQLSIVPSCGLRRNLNDRFNYELGYGIGRRFYFEDVNLDNKKCPWSVSILNLRIGYRIK